MDLVLEKKELSERIKVVRNHKIDLEINLSAEDKRRVDQLVNKYKCNNIIRAKKALDSCILHSQKLVAAKYGVLAVDMDFEKFKPTKRKDVVEWEVEKDYMKQQFYYFIEEGGYEV